MLYLPRDSIFKNAAAHVRFSPRDHCNRHAQRRRRGATSNGEMEKDAIKRILPALEWIAATANYPRNDQAAAPINRIDTFIHG